MNNIRFEKFTENHINAAIELTLKELAAEKQVCPALPEEELHSRLKGLLNRLSGLNFGTAALEGDRLVGYILFIGPIDGFHSSHKGVFCPLGGSAFDPEHPHRVKLASLLLAEALKEPVDNGCYSIAFTRYAHDDEIGRLLSLRGFGIRCCDAVQEADKLISANYAENLRFTELPRERFREVRPLQEGLNRHLALSPVFFAVNWKNFGSWFHTWINREDMRIFAAFDGERIAGFISVEDDCGENYITPHERMKSICGAYFYDEYRGCGAAAGLLACMAENLKAEGITHLGVDCETLNPTAMGFWCKHFTPYSYSYHRILDDRVDEDLRLLKA